MGVSVKTFFGSFSHFFLGVGHRISDNTLVGNHSQFVDEFARFGLFGGLLSTFTIIRLLKEIRIMADLKPNSVARRHITVLLLVVVMRIFIGSVFDSSVGIVLFVLVPLVFRTIQIEEENG